MDGTLNTTELADFMRSRWTVFVNSAAAALAFAIAASSLIPRQYTATASILIGAPAGSDPRAVTAVNAVYLESLKAYERLALSDTVFARAVDVLKIQEHRGSPAESFRRKVLKVSKLPNTAILEVQATLRNPREAQALAQYIAEQTVELSKSVNARSTKDATREFRDQMDAAEAALQTARQVNQAFARAEPVEILETELYGNGELKSSLDRDLVIDRTELAALNAGEPASREPEVSSLRARMAAIENERRELATVIAIQSNQLATRRNRREVLEANVESAQRAFDAARAKLNDALSAASNRGENLQIIDPGIVPEQPSYPDTLLNLVAALLVSLAGSAVWLAFRFSYSRLESERGTHVFNRRRRHDIDLSIQR
jgi:capsule polysaccharide export protein KpsE/RkpR